MKRGDQLPPARFDADNELLPAACSTLKDETACGARTDCNWVAAVTDSKTGKEKRKAYCRRAPAAAKKK